MRAFEIFDFKRICVDIHCVRTVLERETPQKEGFEALNLKNFASKVVMNNIDSSVNKPDLNGRYGTIEQYRYVLIRIGFEQVTIKEKGSLSIVGVSILPYAEIKQYYFMNSCYVYIYK